MIRYREIQHLGCDCLVNEDGDVFTKDSTGEYVHRDWRSNKDGYAVVSATGFKPNGEKYYRTLHVHILVAKAFIPNRRAAIDALIEIGVANPSYNKESIIRKLSNRGYKGYHLTDA